jgi:hypothetical protein
MQTDWRSEVLRYDAVLFLETAAAGGYSISAGNDVRTETLQAAISVDAQLRAVWANHPNCVFVSHEREFATKVARGSAILRDWLNQP